MDPSSAMAMTCSRRRSMRRVAWRLAVYCACGMFLLHTSGYASVYAMAHAGGHPSIDAAEQQASAYERNVQEIQKQIESGNLEQARGLIVAAEGRFPHNGGLENLLGVVEIQEGYTAEAIRAFQAAIRDNPRLASAYLNLSRIRMPEAATDKAARAETLRLSQKVLEMDPGNDEARYQMATSYLWNGDHRLSLE